MERERREESDDSRKREVGRGKRVEGLTDTLKKHMCTYAQNTSHKSIRCIHCVHTHVAAHTHSSPVSSEHN